MDKETLSNYGWIVICVLILAVMIALATPFGDFIASGVKSTTKGLFSTSQKALNSTGLITIEENFYEKEINHSAKIPEGGVYYKGVGNTAEKDYTGYTEMLISGNAFPTISTGDVYVYGDYEYRYQIAYCAEHNVFDACPVAYQDSPKGWCVRYIGESITPVSILRIINEQPITSLKNTFKDKNITSSPSIPSTVTDMTGTFAYSNIKESPHIPNGVKYLRATFCHTPIKVAPTIPSTVEVMYAAFSSCTELIDIRKVTIPYGVKSVQSLFDNCYSLVDASNIIIPATVNNVSWMFHKCINLEKIPTALPNSVKTTRWMFGECEKLKNGNLILNEGITDIGYMYWNCINLNTAPEIPSTVTCVRGTFEYCSSLYQEMVVHGNPNDISGFLYGSRVTSISGRTEIADLLIATRTIPHEPD